LIEDFENTRVTESKENIPSTAEALVRN